MKGIYYFRQLAIACLATLDSFLEYLHPNSKTLDLFPELTVEERMRERFVAVLQLLCLPFEQQRDYYKDFVYVPQGIISDIFDDQLAYKEILLQANLLTPSVYERVLRYEEMVIAFVDLNGADFPLECINSLDWKAISASAREILVDMDYPIDPPNPYWM